MTKKDDMKIVYRTYSFKATIQYSQSQDGRGVGSQVDYSGNF